MLVAISNRLYEKQCLYLLYYVAYDSQIIGSGTTCNFLLAVYCLMDGVVVLTNFDTSSQVLVLGGNENNTS